VLNPNFYKGNWDKEEDEKIIELVAKHGPNNWSKIASELDGRIGKQCRERWYNHLSPEINKTPWSAEEEEFLIKTQSMIGNKWSAISKLLIGRTDNAVKNRFNSLMARKNKGKVVTPTKNIISKDIEKNEIIFPSTVQQTLNYPLSPHFIKKNEENSNHSEDFSSYVMNSNFERNDMDMNMLIKKE
jgi:hypothetical protein